VLKKQEGRNEQRTEKERMKDKNIEINKGRRKTEGKKDNLRVCIQKFPDWPPGARTANGTALCH